MVFSRELGEGPCWVELGFNPCFGLELKLLGPWHLMYQQRLKVCKATHGLMFCSQKIAAGLHPSILVFYAYGKHFPKTIFSS